MKNTLKQNKRIIISCLIIIFSVSLVTGEFRILSSSPIPSISDSLFFIDNFNEYNQSEPLTNSKRWTQTYNTTNGSVPHWYFSNNSLYKLGYTPSDYSSDSSHFIDDIALANSPVMETSFLISSKFNTQNNSQIGLLFNYQNSSNFYKAIMSSNSKNIIYEIYKKVNGKTILIAKSNDNNVSKYNNTWINLSLLSDKNSLQLYVNGKSVIKTDEKLMQNGKAGIYSWPQTTSYIEDFKIIEF